MAGVMAHELAHVALRHGTAQATKGEKFQIGSIAGQILGAIVGGTAGNVISGASTLGLGTYFLKYGREYERQADLLGAQIMAQRGLRSAAHGGHVPHDRAAEPRLRRARMDEQPPESGQSSRCDSPRVGAELQVRGNAENNARVPAGARAAGQDAARLHRRTDRARAGEPRAHVRSRRLRRGPVGRVSVGAALDPLSLGADRQLPERERAAELGADPEQQRCGDRAGRRLLSERGTATRSSRTGSKSA